MRSLAATLALVLAFALPIAAQQRTLSWPRIDVAATLDADGRLWVVERQVMRFDGDWNGGERRFAVGARQRLGFGGITRFDPATGATYAMRRGDIDRVDGWSIEGTTVRWRSRRPEDPPFRDSTIGYELQFAYEQILVADRERPGHWRLDHDFAFRTREGMVDTLVVVLAIDPAWRAEGGDTQQWAAYALPPGKGFGVDVPLVRVATTPPAAARIPPPPENLWLPVFAAMAIVAAALLRVLAHERALGRFASVPDVAAVTPAFLERELLAHLPEVVGASWDATTASPEVAALLARLVQEGKLASRVEARRAAGQGDDVLHLDLLVDPATLAGHERTLVDALFDPGQRTTSTAAVRRRYAKTGFDPGALLARGLAPLTGSASDGSAPLAASRLERTWLPLAFAAAAVVLAILGGMDDPVPTPVVVFVGAILSVPLFFVAAAAAGTCLHRTSGLLTPWRWLVAALLGNLLGLGLLLADDRFGIEPSRWSVGALCCVQVAMALMLTARMRVATTRAHVAWRRNLAAARAFLARELERPAPRLEDAWYPYLLALGLGPDVDRWFRAFGGASARTATTTTIGVSGASDTSSGSDTGFGGFGGGGGFSGGGGGAEFGSAVGAFAAAVPSPSSSSSSGISSSSSGGGGGGGW